MRGIPEASGPARRGGTPAAGRIGGALLVVALGVVGGCVYYNTFYHAEKYYEEGVREVERDGRVTKKANDQFRKSIQKCVKILTDYPGSAYADDALLLMGKALFQKGDEEEAINSFEKLLAEHPGSDRRAEALYWAAKARFHGGKYPECLLTIEKLRGERLDPDRRAEIAFLKGEAYYLMENYAASLEQFEALLQGESTARWRDEASLRMAQSRFRLEEYDQALADFQSLVESVSSLSLRREGYFWIASSFSEIGRHRDAAAAYRRLLEGELTEEEALRARIALGRELIEIGENDEALEVLELVTFDSPKTEEAAEANYLRGTLFLERMGDSDRAREEFRKGYRQLPDSEHGRLCEAKWREVERWRKLHRYVRGEMGKEASPQGLPQARYLMAEFELHDLRNLDEALAGFRAVADSFPDSPWAAKAAYARAWLLETEAADTTGAEEEYRALIERYPDTRYADFARMRMDIDLPERPAGFYEDEQEGRLLAAVQVEGEIPMQAVPDSAVPDSGVSIPDSLAAPPDSLAGETSAEGDSLP